MIHALSAPIPRGMNPPPFPDPVNTPTQQHWAGALSQGFLPPLIFSLLCLLAAEINYLFFHALAEISSIVVAFTAMVVATTSAKFAKNHFVVFVSVAIGWCAGIDLIHTLVFKGMHLLSGDSANPATQLWLVARYMQALVLLISPFALRRYFSPLRLHLAFGLVASLLVAWVFSGHFPVAYVDGQGLTPFKIYSELVIIAMLGLFILRLSRARADMTPRVFYSLLAAAASMMLSEAAFTQYVSVYANANLVGHLLKIFSYWFVYIALVHDTIREPFVQLQEEIRERRRWLWSAKPWCTIWANASRRRAASMQPPSWWSAPGNRLKSCSKGSRGCCHRALCCPTGCWPASRVTGAATARRVRSIVPGKS